MEKSKDYAKSLLIAVILSFGIRVAVVEAYYVPTGSMIPTIMENDRIMSNKFIYRLTEPVPGDIVVFTPSGNIRTGAPRLVKRLIGTGGDRIEVRNGTVYRNGRPLFEPYVNQAPDYTLPPLRVPEGYVFVLGDNRRNSYDSHVWGFLPRDNIIAKPCSATGRRTGSACCDSGARAPCRRELSFRHGFSPILSSAQWIP